MSWWSDFVDSITGGSSPSPYVGYTPEFQYYQPGAGGAIEQTQQTWNRRSRTPTPEMDAAADQQQRDLNNLGGANNLRNLIAQEMASQQGGMQDGGFWDFYQALGLGGGGADLSGYNAMLEDVAAREAALGARYAEQQDYITGLIDAARALGLTMQGEIAPMVESQLEADATRRQAQQDYLRNQDAGRLALANRARGALGVNPAVADEASRAAQSGIGAISAGGDVADRDARIRESLLNQQINRQIFSLDPMALAANAQLSNAYEDRLAQLASERAGLQGQMAAARSSGSGNSISQMSQAYDLYNQLYGPGDLPETMGGLGVLQSYQGNLGGDYAGVYNRVQSILPSIDFIDPATGRPKTSYQITNEIVQANPDLVSSYDFINQLVQAGL